MPKQRGNNKKSMSNCKLPFPWKLYQLLEDASEQGFDDIISWDADGTCFRVHKPNAFSDTIMKEYFRQKHFKSFTRQLYMYGFSKIMGSASPPSKPKNEKDEICQSFVHPDFVRSNKVSCLSVTRDREQDRRKSASNIATTFPTSSAVIRRASLSGAFRRASIISASSGSSVGSSSSNCTKDASNDAAVAAGIVLPTLTNADRRMETGKIDKVPETISFPEGGNGGQDEQRETACLASSALRDIFATTMLVEQKQQEQRDLLLDYLRFEYKKMTAVKIGNDSGERASSAEPEKDDEPMPPSEDAEQQELLTVLNKLVF